MHGTELRRLRESAGLSLVAVASRGKFSKGHLSNVEKGVRTPTAAVVAAYEEALGVTIANPVNELSRLCDAAGGAPVPSRVGVSDVLVVEQATEMLTEWDLERGGGQACAMAKGQLQWSLQLLDQSMTDEVRTRWTVAVARLANRAGFSYFDAGAVGSASRMSDVAYRASREAGDPDLQACVLADIAGQSLDMGDLTTAFAALERTPEALAPVTRFVVNGVRALANAHAGRVTATWQYIAATEDAYTAIDVAKLPDGMGPFVGGHAAHLDADTGKALFVLSRSGSPKSREASRERLARAIQGFGHGRTRAVVQNRARLARLHESLGDLDGARHHAIDARRDGAALRSTRVQARLRQLDPLIS